VVIVSIDPAETPEIAEVKRRASIVEYGRSGSSEGWNFLVGTEENIRQLADTIGFRYAYDANIDQYVHPSGVLVITPEGRLARYFYGIDYPPQDLRLGLVEAANNKIGSPVDQFLLTCYHYDPVSGEYTLAIMNIIRIVGVTTVLIIGAALFLMLRRDWSKPATPHPA
jgi:protein SCO1/2